MVEIPGLSRLGTALRTQRVSRAYGIEALARVLEDYLPPEQIAKVRRAAEFAEAAHRGQFRSSGEPYVFHPLAVARILAEMRMDPTTLMAAILHDVVEDTPTMLSDVAARFGADVAQLVDGVSKFSRAQHQSREEAQAESFRKLLMAMVQDVRVMLIKLADRLHNLRTLDYVSPERRGRIARETLDIYAPIAQRLGIHTLRVELEDHAFAHLYPKRHKVLKQAVAEQTGDQKDVVREVEQRLRESLKNEGIAATVTGREKNLYSIYLKMRRSGRRFLEVMDIYGFRVIVDSVDACYRALGVVHHAYRPISDQFNDFIANQKANGYQSLHTTLLGPQGVKVEVQIRTKDMQQIAEQGIASHWQYKLGAGGGAPQLKAREWLGALLEMDKETSAQEFLESVKIELFPEEVYLFTPKGEVRRLPRKSTPVDFAYAIHTDLGNRCVAAKVDQHLAPLSTPLENGQTVEIITARTAMPNPAWLFFVRTIKARNAIRHYLKNQQVEQAEDLGRRLLNKSLRELGVAVRKLRDEQVQRALRQMNLPSLGQLYVSIGLGQRLAPLAARHFLDAGAMPQGVRTLPIAVEGTEGLVVEYAKCCYPVPGDAILGHVSAGRGVVIHRIACKVARSKHQAAQEWIDLRWSKRVKGDFPVELKLEAKSERGVLATIATQIAEAGSNIERVSMPEKNEEVSVLRVRVSVSDRHHLAQIMRRLRRIPVVQKVGRA
ncbi:MAG: RelA/SpoT family protein [Nevskiales bacterium]